MATKLIVSLLLVAFVIKSVWTHSLAEAEHKIVDTQEFEDVKKKTLDLRKKIGLSADANGNVDANKVSEFAKALANTNEFKSLVDKEAEELEKE